MLLGLATSLAQLTGTRDITRRLATAITELVDCDGALVFDPVAGRGRIVAAEGFDPLVARGQWIGSLVARWRIGPSACSPARGATARRWE